MKPHEVLKHFASPCREVSSSWRTTLSSSLTSSGTKLSTPRRKTAGGYCATWFATSSPQTSSSSLAVWAKGSGPSTQETRAWRDGRSTPSKSAASEVQYTAPLSSHLGEHLRSSSLSILVHTFETCIQKAIMSWWEIKQSYKCTGKESHFMYVWILWEMSLESFPSLRIDVCWDDTRTIAGFLLQHQGSLYCHF